MENLIQVDVDGTMIMHMAMDTGHILKYECTIHCKGNLVDGRKFYKEIYTPKRRGSYGKWGKAEVTYYFNNDDPPFKTGEALLNSIGCTLAKKK